MKTKVIVMIYEKLTIQINLLKTMYFRLIKLSLKNTYAFKLEEGIH